MKYIDLHTDALTTEGVRQVSKHSLEAGGCCLQCFAAFLPSPAKGFSRAMELCDAYDALIAEWGLHSVRQVSDMVPSNCAMLTIEGGGAIEGSLQNLEALYGRGVRLMTLTWNDENALGFSNVRAGEPNFREEERGLKPFGREVVQKMRALGMIIDVSHGSDKLFYDVAEGSKRSGIPFVASHSDACAVHPVSRNLTDGQIRALADCGGVMGLNFYTAFLGGDRSPAGQRAALLAHAEHILKVGGEEVLSIGSDFDGIPPNPYLPTAAEMPKLLMEFEHAFGSRITQKIAYRNALRVFRDVLRG